jgi:hypothetical protein
MEKANVFLYYIDDSGSRDPDRNPKQGQTEPDWFALGGVLLNTADKDECDAKIAGFRGSWPQIGNNPLHSYEIRNKTKAFRWLESLAPEDLAKFMDGLSSLIVSLPIVVAGCVVHRPGYNTRYMEEYGPRRWKLCRTAFNIALERAAKYAHHHGGKLRVYVERTDRVTESHFKEYYDSLRTDGPPFDAKRSAQYLPMSSEQLHQTLYEFKVKTKQSDLMQLADLCLWPICMGGYDQAHRAYAALKGAGKLIDVHCTAANQLLGIKYSCFDSSTP